MKQLTPEQAYTTPRRIAEFIPEDAPLEILQKWVKWGASLTADMVYSKCSPDQADEIKLFLSSLGYAYAVGVATRVLAPIKRAGWWSPEVFAVAAISVAAECELYPAYAKKFGFPIAVAYMTYANPNNEQKIIEKLKDALAAGEWIE